MSLTRTTVAVAVALALVGACVSHSIDDAPSVAAGPDAAAPLDGASDATSDVAAPVDAGADVFVPATAVGDPCRGLPLPAAQHFVAKDACARLVESSLYNFRQITFAPNGDLFGVDYGGDIVLMRDEDGDGYFSSTETHLWGANGDNDNGNNCHIDVASGYVYIGSLDGVVRLKWTLGKLTADGPPERVVTGEPTSGHPYHTVHVYDGYLYVHSGSRSDVSNPTPPDYDTDRSVLRRFPLASFDPANPFEWTTGELVSVGLRNMVGFTKNAAGRMYGVVNGIDFASYQGVDVRDDNPGEQVVELGIGKQFGYPFCFTAQRVVVGGAVVPPGTQLWNEQTNAHDDAWCATHSTPPTTFVQAHAAPLDILFFDTQPKGGLPERWRGGAFVSMHGSYQRPAGSVGYKVVWIPFDAAGKAPMPTSTLTTTTFPYETVFGGGSSAGAVDGEWSWDDGTNNDSPRPVGVAISPVDGALYISTDTGRKIYRVGLAH